MSTDAEDVVAHFGLVPSNGGTSQMDTASLLRDLPSRVRALRAKQHDCALLFLMNIGAEVLLTEFTLSLGYLTRINIVLRRVSPLGLVSLKIKIWIVDRDI